MLRAAPPAAEPVAPRPRRARIVQRPRTVPDSRVAVL